MDYKFVQSGNLKICYQERGSGEPLVLIMGFGADGNTWEKHAAVYEKHFRCIIPDNLGVGLSDQPLGPYTTEQMAASVIAVMDHAGVINARVAGISMGGAIAQELAINFPDRVKRLVLVSTWARFNQYATAVYENLKHVRPALSGEHFTELLQLWIFAPPFYEKNREALREDARAAVNNASPQTKNGFDGQLDACIHHNSVERLSRIKVPTLITVGLKDIFTPPEFSYVLQREISGSVLTSFPEGGHAHHWEDLERFNRETLEFLLKN